MQFKILNQTEPNLICQLFRLYNLGDVYSLKGGFMQKKNVLGMDPLSWLKKKG